LKKIQDGGQFCHYHGNRQEKKIGSILLVDLHIKYALTLMLKSLAKEKKNLSSTSPKLEH